jgi:glycosyltransferase involved in cell wall biosynthesis
MKVIIFPRYDSTQASTRVRVLQYLPFLKEAGIDFEVFPIINFDGISGRINSLAFWKSRLKSYYRVGRRLFKEKGKESLIHIHSELFPFMPFWLEYGYLLLLGKKKYIIELDDAWFHRYNANNSILIRLFLSKKIDLLMRHSVLVIAGNQYIADRAKLAGAKCIEIIPTVVDVEKYMNYLLSLKKIKSIYNKKVRSSLKEAINYKSKPVIGWIGTPSTTKFLLTIKNIITLMNDNGIANFVAIGADSYQLRGLPVTVIPWNEENELETLSQFDIGIMPLSDSLFERGKCGYKLIQYMACGLPVVASPVGVNSSIVVHNETGFLASKNDEWLKYLTLLCSDLELRNRLGQKGLIRVNELYSLRVTSPKYVSLLKNMSSY